MLVWLRSISCPFPKRAFQLISSAMSAGQIIEELPRLTPAELQAIERRILEITTRYSAKLRPEISAGRLVLVGPRIIRQTEVDDIMEELP